LTRGVHRTVNNGNARDNRPRGKDTDPVTTQPAPDVHDHDSIDGAMDQQTADRIDAADVDEPGSAPPATPAEDEHARAASMNNRIAAELAGMLEAAEQRAIAAQAAPLRLMAVHAHPDDESSKGAATLARYAADGIGVMVVSCTGGERGDILNPKYTLGELDIPQLRQSEMARAAEILGVAHAWLGYEDSG